MKFSGEDGGKCNQCGAPRRPHRKMAGIMWMTDCNCIDPEVEELIREYEARKDAHK